MNVTRTVFLSFHVAGGVLGLLVGLFAFRPPQTRQFRLGLRRAYAAALVILAVFLVAIVAVDWSILGATQRIVVMVNRYKRDIVPGPIGSDRQVRVSA